MNHYIYLRLLGVKTAIYPNCILRWLPCPACNVAHINYGTAPVLE